MPHSQEGKTWWLSSPNSDRRMIGGREDFQVSTSFQKPARNRTCEPRQIFDVLSMNRSSKCRIQESARIARTAICCRDSISCTDSTLINHTKFRSAVDQEKKLPRSSRTTNMHDICDVDIVLINWSFITHGVGWSGGRSTNGQRNTTAIRGVQSRRILRPFVRIRVKQAPAW